MNSTSSTSESQLAQAGLSFLHVLVVFSVTFFVVCFMVCATFFSNETQQVIVFFALGQSRLAQRRKNLQDLPRSILPITKALLRRVDFVFLLCNVLL